MDSWQLLHSDTHSSLDQNNRVGRKRAGVLVDIISETTIEDKDTKTNFGRHGHYLTTETVRPRMVLCEPDKG